MCGTDQRRTMLNNIISRHQKPRPVKPGAPPMATARAGKQTYGAPSLVNQKTALGG